MFRAVQLRENECNNSLFATFIVGTEKRFSVVTKFDLTTCRGRKEIGRQELGNERVLNEATRDNKPKVLPVK